MSQHSSLRSDKKGGHYRNVLKRWEKIKFLLQKEEWDKDEDSVFSLPKVKRIKLKIKKKRSAEKETKEAKEGEETLEEKKEKVDKSAESKSE